MEKSYEKQLKKVKRQIWWIETKVGWLRFSSGRSIFFSFRFFPLMYFMTILLPIYIIYLGIDHFYLLGKLSKFFVIISLFFLVCYFGYILDKIMVKRIKFLEQKLSLLYMKKRGLAEDEIIINKKS